jgi:hypothetical protein
MGMIKLKEILSEKKTELKDYPKDIQKKYNEYLKTWGKEFADRYLEREDDPNDKSEKTLAQDIYEKLKVAKQDAAKEMKQKKYGADKYTPTLFKHYSIQLRKIGKITDSQIMKLFTTESIKTIWSEQKYLLKIFNK